MASLQIPLRIKLHLMTIYRLLLLVSYFRKIKLQETYMKLNQHLMI